MSAESNTSEDTEGTVPRKSLEEKVVAFSDTTINVTLPWNLDHIKDLLKGSLEMPVNFELFIPRSRWSLYPTFNSDLALLCSLMAEYLIFFRRLVIKVNDGLSNTEPFFDLFNEMYKPLPLLRELVIEDSVEYEPGIVPPPVLFGSLPCLTSAIIGVCGLFPGSAYKQLTTFHFYTGFVTFHNFHCILSNFHDSAIRTLALYGSFLPVVDVKDEDDDDEEVINELPPQLENEGPYFLPHLSEFHSYDHDSSELTSLFHLIHGAQLRRVVIASNSPVDFSFLNTSDLPKYLGVKNILITVTRGENSEKDPFDIHRASICFPNVEEATFLGPDFSIALNNLGIACEDGQLPFPSLRSISIEDSYPLRNLVQIREAHEVPLKKVYLTPKAALHQPEMKWLENREVDMIEENFLEDERKKGLFYPFRKYGCRAIVPK